MPDDTQGRGIIPFVQNLAKTPDITSYGIHPARTGHNPLITGSYALPCGNTRPAPTRNLLPLTKRICLNRANLSEWQRRIGRANVASCGNKIAQKLLAQATTYPKIFAKINATKQMK